MLPRCELRLLRGALDGIYCVDIQEHPKRLADVTALFHREGMCRDVIFYRPRRGPFSTLAIWTSHREVAREALRRGQVKILAPIDASRRAAAYYLRQLGRLGDQGRFW
jgi:hypothetical protein